MTQKLPPYKPGKGKKKKQKEDAPPQWTAAEIQKTLDDLTDTSNVRTLVLELLYGFVALTENTLFQQVSQQVEISQNVETFARTLRRYVHDGLIDYLSYDILKMATKAGLSQNGDRRLLAFGLGPVGAEYARRKGWNPAPIKQIPEEHLAHDLICAEAMLRMAQLWRDHPSSPGLAEILGQRQVVVWDQGKKRSVLEPDGLIVKHGLDGAIQRAYLVEYQNVRALIQAQHKIAKYEELAQAKDSHWIWGSWELEEMPVILILYRQPSTLKHYQIELATREKTFATYAAISLREIWSDQLPIRVIRKAGEEQKAE